MIEVYYVKFYQAVQFGKMLESFLGGDKPKIANAEMTYQNGMLTVKIPGVRNTCVPFSNIMYFHEKEVGQVKKASK